MSRLAIPDDQDADARELILDHFRNPRYFRKSLTADWTAEANNPLCGDRYRVFLQVSENRIESVSFTGTGCSISMASASMMTVITQRMAIAEVRPFLDHVDHFLQGGTPEVDLGDLIAFAGIRGNPVRLRCVQLPWNALKSAIPRTVSTHLDGPSYA